MHPAVSSRPRAPKARFHQERGARHGHCHPESACIRCGGPSRCAGPGFQHDHGERPQHQVRSHLQTCISFLLARKDLDKAYQAVQLLSPKPYRRLEKVQDVALVGIVGKGLLRRKGIAARCFTAVAERNVNVEMISFGPSEVAVYFLVRNKDLQKAVEAIHTSFFSTGLQS